ncbi:DUF7146 domain-containing protein [Rhizobium sp. BR 362]|uniref:DUF7146 domain-containing protein n=1 Tax=Rhizobium sp. BR 362 TaxID=3040670 RepID=UPI002F3FAD96
MIEFHRLASILDGRPLADCQCPECMTGCSPHGQARKVLRLWRLSDRAISYACARCGASGFVTSGEARTLAPAEWAAMKRRQAEAKAGDEAEKERKRQLAMRLWSRGRPVAGTPAETYFRRHRGIACPLPSSLLWLPPSCRFPGAAMLPFEDPATGTIKGLHLTTLKADGMKIEKKMLGPGSAGYPLVCAMPEGCDHLVIAEGVEEALSLHQATGLPSWAAGSAGRLPGLAAHVPLWARLVTIVKDDDDAGRMGSLKLQRLMHRQRREVAILEAV